MKTMKRVLCWMLVAAMVFGVMPFASFADESNEVVGREVVSLSGEWQFTEDGETTTVTVPHCWGHGGDSSAKEVKTCTYEKEIDVSAYEGKELFLYFEAINKTAKVYVDDVLLATHVGGYYAFAVDITAACEGKDKVTVKVEAVNSDYSTVPLYSDFTYFGGIYRDVWLYAVDPAAYISNEDYGSNGLYFASNVNLEDGSATIDATVMLTNTEEAVVKADVIDAEGNVVASAEKTVTETGRVQEVKLDTITIANAHLWNGTIDPYLYTVEVTVTVNGVEVDSVEDRIGLRTFEVKDGEFWLNGEIYDVRGVGMHQDGWSEDGDTYATTDAQKIADLEMVKEMGANAIRIAHYPHDDVVFDWADENGFLLWDEIPNFVFMFTTEDFINNTQNNVIEMVKQGYNYPSVIIWGVANEVNDHTATFNAAAANAEQLNEIINGLADLVRELDPSRLVGEAQIDSTKWAQETADWTTSESNIDVVGFNLYTGWYGNVNGATVENKTNRLYTALQNKLKKFQAMYDESSGKVSYCLTEYGAGANINQHDDLGADFLWGGTNPDKGYVSGGYWHPEEYQCYVHEGLYMAIYGDETLNLAPADNLWAAFIWAMFDFSCYRSEGGQLGVNDKGMVTQDRQVKKDAFYLYKANWNKDDLFTHITAKRFEVRDTQTIDVKVYSNCDSVELIVDGVSYGNGTLEQDGVFVWHGVQLKQDETVLVEAIGTKDGEVVYTDTCDTWSYSATAKIESDSDLNKVYDGEPVADPEYTVTADGQDVTDDAQVTIEWYEVEGTTSDDDDENAGSGTGSGTGSGNVGTGSGDIGTGSGGVDDSENPGYGDDDSENPGYGDDDEDYGDYIVGGYDDEYESGSGVGSGTGTGNTDDDYDAAAGGQLGTGSSDKKLDGAPSEVGKYYCLIKVADGSNGEINWLANSLRINFEITDPNADIPCDGTECPSMAFTDLAAKFAEEGYDTWWHPYTDYVIENGLMIGMETDVFDLDTDTTRAMVTMVLWRLAGSPETEYVAGTYTDVVAEQWFAEPIAWAHNVGILEGYGDGNVGPDDVMLREDIVNMFYRYAQYLEDINTGSGTGSGVGSGTGTGYSLGSGTGTDEEEEPGSGVGSGIGSGSGTDDDVLLNFADYADISDYAVDAMRWAVENGLILGYENNTLLPKGAVDRSELAAFLMRWCEDIVK